MGSRAVRCGALIVAVVVVVVALGVIPVSAFGAGSVDTAGAPKGPFVVSVPRGWFVRGATLPAAQAFEQSFPLYGRPGHLDPAHDALLSTGFQGDGDVDQLLGKATPVPGLGENGLEGRLVRNGEWAWVTWSAVGGVDPFLAAHGLTDRQVIAAARAAAVDPEGRSGPTVAKAGLPSGFAPVASAPIGPDYGPSTAELVTLVKADGISIISTRVMTASAGAQALVRFWAAQRALRGDPGTDQRQITRAAVRARGGTLIVASGPAPQSTLTKLVDSAKPANEATWQAFRGRVLDLPVSAVIPTRGGSPPDAVVLDGRTDTARWVVSISGALPVMMAFEAVVSADGYVAGAGSAGPGDLTPGIVTITGANFSGGGVNGSLVVGAAPAAAAGVRLQAGSGVPVDATLGPPGPDAAHRYFSSFLANAQGKVAAVAVDAAGHELARKSDMGCTACP